jgi:hypothetical protein
MTKRELLQHLTFGERTAEEEENELEAYFVETDEWRLVYNGSADVIYGPKGSGKSAIYALLMRRVDTLFDGRILITAAENVRGAPVFQSLTSSPPADEEQLRKMWKLYFITLLGHAFREYGISTSQSTAFLRQLEEADLIPATWSLRNGLRAVLSYLSRIVQPEGIEGGIAIDPITGSPAAVTGKILFRDPSAEEKRAGVVSVEDLFEIANAVLKETEYQIWIVLDRLDVAFATSPELERNALRALFRVYQDLRGYEKIRPKIFIRNDIWRQITGGGFREASHIIRSVDLRWTPNTLMNLVIRRILRNEALIGELNLDANAILGDSKLQEELFYRIFPQQVDIGLKKRPSFDWILSRTRDGSGENVPRELIHLLTEAKRIQLQRINTGQGNLEGDRLFENTVLREALPEVSRVRLERTLYAEYPDVKPWLERLERERTEHTTQTLAEIWALDESEAASRAERLVEIGFFERRGTKQNPTYWVPFLYRPALDLVQGAAQSSDE